MGGGGRCKMSREERHCRDWRWPEATFRRALDRGQETCVSERRREGGVRRVSGSRQHALQRARRGLMLSSCSLDWPRGACRLPPSLGLRLLPQAGQRAYPTCGARPRQLGRALRDWGRRWLQQSRTSRPWKTALHTVLLRLKQARESPGNVLTCSF